MRSRSKAIVSYFPSFLRLLVSVISAPATSLVIIIHDKQASRLIKITITLTLFPIKMKLSLRGI